MKRTIDEDAAALAGTARQAEGVPEAYAKGERSGGNARNGVIAKTVQAASGRCRCRSRGAGRGRSTRSWSRSGPGGSPGPGQHSDQPLSARHFGPGHHLPPAAGLRDRAVARDGHGPLS